MALSMTLRVTGIDLDDATVGSTLATELPLLLWQGDDRYATATFDVDEHDAVARVVDVARTIEAIAPGAKVLGTDRDLVSTTEIASRVGVSREGALKWTKEACFPAPFAIIGSRTSTWSWAAVTAWLLDSRGIDMDEALPSEPLLTQIDNYLFRNPDATTVQWHELSTNIEGGRPQRRLSSRRTSTVRVEKWIQISQDRSSWSLSSSTASRTTAEATAWVR